MNAVIHADFNQMRGVVKPMHGVGQPPFYMDDFEMFSYLKDAGIPYSRLHDVGGWMGGGLYVDIPNLFRDFDADPYDPESYDFTFTDRIIQKLMEHGCEPFFRLGVTIENDHMLKTYRLYPPKDFQKWAVICEHVVAHYIDGWADGYTYPIRYWEIWNEPDDCYTEETSAMWKGTPQQFYELYHTAATHLKSVFGDRIKVGGYAHCGFYAYDKYPDLGNIGRNATEFTEFFFEFLDGFFKYIRERSTPLDFFSWHTYADVETSLIHADVCRGCLDKNGFGHVEDILNEWNPCAEVKLRNSSKSAAWCLGIMLGMQRKSTSVLCYYDARIGPSSYAGLFNPDTWQPTPAYYAFKSFGEAYRLGKEAECSCEGKGVYAMAATDTYKKLLLIANTNEDAVSCELSVASSEHPVSVKLITDGCIYQEVPLEIKDGKLVLPGYTCAEIEYQ